MSTGRMGARAALATVGVLVSVALMAAPSWAAGGNSARALCTSYPGVLFAQDGSAFKNAGLCTAYGARGDQLAGVNGVAEPLPNGLFFVTWTGFGMAPGSDVFGGVRYQPSGISVGDNTQHVAGDGTFVARTNRLPCGDPVDTVDTLVVQATTAAGTGFVLDIPFPAGVC